MPNNLRNFIPTSQNITLEEYEKFLQLPESSPLMLINSAGTIVYANKSFKYTFSLQEGAMFYDLETEPNIADLLSFLSGSTSTHFQFDLFLSPKYHLKSYEYSVEMEKIFINKEAYFVLIFKSLEEQIKLEEKINNLHNALEYGEVPVIITDEHGYIKYATSSFEKILNADIEDIFKQPITEALASCLSKEELKKVEEAIVNVDIWKRTISSIEEGQKVTFKELKLNPVYRGGSEALSFILTANDITNYILKNQFIKKSEKRLKSIINNISDLLLIVKKKKGALQFETANDNFCRIFKVDKKQAYRQGLTDVLDEPLYGKLIANINNFDQGINDYVEFTHHENNNRYYSVKITFIEDYQENEKLYIISLQDITDQKRYEEQLKKAYEKEIQLNKLKTAFLENMSHEIRTPFNAIIGYSEIIDDCLESEEYETLKTMTISVKDVMNRVLNLFNNIVEVFQIEAGEAKVDLEKIEAVKLLKSVYEKKLKEAAVKNLNFTFNSQQNEVFILTDTDKYEKVIHSLVDNSIKYTSQGEVAINSKLSGDKLNIVISDTGKGIKTSEINRMLMPFAQEEEGYTRNYEGAGLGLTLAYRYTQMLGGTLQIDSKENKGTNITLTFPLKAGE